MEAGDHDDPSTVAAIGKNHADIICLQESTPEFETVLRLRYGDEYPYQLYQHNQPDPGAAGLAVLSKFPCPTAVGTPDPTVGTRPGTCSSRHPRASCKS